MSTTSRDRTRSAVASEYGHPWPWRVEELVERYAVERDVDYRDLAKEWGCNPKVLHTWIRKHGFRTEEYRVIR